MALIQLTKRSVLVGGGPTAAAASGGMGHPPVMMHAVRVASGTKIKVNLGPHYPVMGGGEEQTESGAQDTGRKRERESRHNNYIHSMAVPMQK